MSKVTTLREALSELVRDEDSVAIEGFTHLICFAAGHELIRQRRRDLTLCRLTPDVIADQMVGAGVVSKLVFSWLGNPGVGSLHAVRRRVEDQDPEPLQLEEYSHFGMVARYTAGASRLPFFPLRSYDRSDLPAANPRIVPIASPYGDETLYAVPPLNPDVAIVHVQRASVEGDAQAWGLLGCQKEAALASSRVVVVCEELVEAGTVRSDPNRTIIPGFVVDAVVVEPRACHPSFAQGYYDRDNDFYLEWDQISRNAEALDGWLAEWVYGLESHAEYVNRLGEERWARLAPTPAWAEPVNYGTYR